jgi:hypothetical protein
MIKMKRAIIAGLAIFLLAGCTPEIKESKQESKNATQKTEIIQKNQSQEAYNPLTDDETIYMKTIGKLIDTYSKTTEDIRKLMQEANSNPMVAKTDEWMNHLKGDFVAISTMYTVMEGMGNSDAVPERFLDIHGNLSDTFKLMTNAGDLLIQSINKDLNPTLFNESMQLMAQSNEKLNEVNLELDEVQSEVSAK